MSFWGRLYARFQPSQLLSFRDVKPQWVLLAMILFAAAFTRFYRLGEPPRCYFDEVYFPTTGAEILLGDPEAWQFYGHENTHPPLSKLFMAAGQGLFGRQDSAVDNSCWGDEEDADRQTDPNWLFNPFGWRFFGALAGVGSVLFTYLIAKRLFNSEIAGLAGGFLLTFEGLAFTQARIATPDTYVLFFVLGTTYFLISQNFLLSGIFVGAAVATKWNAALIVIPILVYLVWYTIRREQRLGSDNKLVLADLTFAGGWVLAYLGLGLTAFGFLSTRPDESYSPFSGAVDALGPLLMITGALVMGSYLWLRYRQRLSGGERVPLLSAHARAYLGTALIFGVFFVLVPGYVYALTYLPMLANGYGIEDVVRLNRQAYEFHSNLEATHGYQAPWNTWPILMRPVFLFSAVGGNAKIYNLGNPVIFWMALPALGFVTWQGLRGFRASVNGERLALRVRITPRQMALLFVVIGYLGLWLPWAAQPRIMFLYHYLPVLAFAVLALAYAVDWLWHRPERWGRIAAGCFLAAVMITFIYFYPHLAAVDVPQWLDDSYYWFSSWR
jgi:dolichyl-phosphate-mannose--protein O-mannosyl transferase